MTATKQARDKWLAHAVGRKMNPDHAYGLQCKDTIDDYCITFWGNWVNTIRPGNAKDCFRGSNSRYFTKVKNKPQDPKWIPLKGDVIIWGAGRGNKYGHIAVVVSATTKGVTVIEQDGFLQIPARKKFHPYMLPNGSMVIGWLRPKWVESKPKLATATEVKKAYLDILERPADADGLKHYQKYNIAFVRADLKASDEHKRLETKKAAKAKANAIAKALAVAREKERLRIEKLDALEAVRAAETPEDTTQHIQEAIETQERLDEVKAEYPPLISRLLTAIGDILVALFKIIKGE